MDQHPKVTLSWAIDGLERAIQPLGTGLVEDRVRRQFHQLLLAVEHETWSLAYALPATSRRPADAER